MGITAIDIVIKIHLCCRVAEFDSCLDSDVIDVDLLRERYSRGWGEESNSVENTPGVSARKEEDLGRGV